MADTQTSGANPDWLKTTTRNRRNYFENKNIDFTKNKVLCNDGTYAYDISSPNATFDYSKTCLNHGGKAENKQTQNEGKPNLSTPTKSIGSETQNTDSKNEKTSGAYNKNLIIALVLVVGYFAYKKFNK